MEDLTLAELESGNFINKEIAEFCKNHSIYNTSAIVSFFLSNENAGYIEKIPLKVRNEIRDFCKNYVDQQLIPIYALEI